LSDLAIKFVDKLQLGDQLVCQLPIGEVVTETQQLALQNGDTATQRTSFSDKTLLA
jgi:hypothetical protein